MKIKIFDERKYNTILGLSGNNLDYQCLSWDECGV